MTNRRIVCWVGDAPNHRALVCKIAERYEIAGIVIDKKKTVRSHTNFLSRVANRVLFSKIDRAWRSLQEKYASEFSRWPAKTLYVDSINSDAAFRFTSDMQPDLVVVSGTSLVKEPMISIPVSLGIINLHTGLSPYVKGGPNCTNWCISNDQWSLIGSTVLWLSAGIDSGNIILSERLDVISIKRLEEIHFRVMEHAHDIYMRAIQYIISGQPPYQSVPQKSLGKGNLYLSKMWTFTQKRKLIKNLSGHRTNHLPEGVKTVPLPI